MYIHLILVIEPFLGFPRRHCSWSGVGMEALIQPDNDDRQTRDVDFLRSDQWHICHLEKLIVAFLFHQH